MKVRDIIKLIEADGWILVVTKGSHRQYKHPSKSGRVTIAATPAMHMYRFLLVIEKADKNYSAYSPDLPGCVATGITRDEVSRNISEAIEMHVQGLN